jgi:hypothetical protein
MLSFSKMKDHAQKIEGLRHTEYLLRKVSK